MLLIDYYAYNNKLSATHPGEKMLFFVITVGICLALASHATSIAALVVTACATVLLAGVPWKLYLKLLLVPASFLVAGVLAVAVTISGDARDFIWAAQIGSYSVGITTAGLAAAGELFLRSLGAVSCLYFVALTTPLTDMVGVLRRLKMPALVIELMVLIYRFIFIMLDTAGQIYTAQSSRLGYRDLRSGYISLGSLVLSLFIKSYRQSNSIYDALLARCYDGRLNFVENRHRWSLSNIMLILAVDGTITACWLFTGGYGG